MDTKKINFVSLLGIEEEKIDSQSLEKLSDNELKGLLVGIEFSEDEELMIVREFKKRGLDS